MLIKEITQNDLELHQKWLYNNLDGRKLATVVGKLKINVDLRGANLSRADLRYVNLRDVDLSDVNLNSADLRGADLSGVNLSGADLSNACLRGANLSGADLRDADLSGAGLSNANLNVADLRNAKLYDACLRGANLSGAELSGADLSVADLRSANLHSANLSGAKNLLNPAKWLADNFETDDLGYIVYKAIGDTFYNSPDHWKIEAGCYLEEVPNLLPTDECGSGVNFGTLAWILENFIGHQIVVWRCRIRWIDLPGVVVPYNTDGKARCSRLELLAIVE